MSFCSRRLESHVRCQMMKRMVTRAVMMKQMPLMILMISWKVKSPMMLSGAPTRGLAVHEAGLVEDVVAEVVVVAISGDAKKLAADDGRSRCSDCREMKVFVNL